MIKHDINNADTILHPHPGSIPKTPILWPVDQHKANQIQQVKGSAKPQASSVLPTTQPSKSVVPPRTTPPPVSNVRVVTRQGTGQKTVTVQFNHPSGSPYFASANVYLRRAGQAPVLVAGGAKSPVTFTTPNHQAPHAVYVTSIGGWGETPILSSPSHPVRLS